MLNPFELILERLALIEKAVNDFINSQAQQISPPEPEQKRLYGDKEAAKYLGCQPLTVAKLRKSNQIPYYRYGRRFYYYSHELDQAFKGGGRRFGELRGARKHGKQ